MEINIQNVSMTYPSGKQALQNLSLELRSPSLIGLLGPNGAGKSTLMKLLVAALLPTSGSILVDGQPLLKTERQLKAQLGYLPQDFGLFNELTVAQFLDYMAALKGLRDSGTAVREVIRTVNLEGQARARIRSLSGGQRQRLCIARALLKKPKILILDDSTSAVDTKTDKLIRSAFHNEIPDTTKIIIAQRVASVQESDMILVMDSGRIMASGTHDELLATCDEYRSIYESQTKNQAQPEELAAAEQAAESSTAEPSETVTVTVPMPTADTSAADTNAADTKEGEAR